MGQIDNSIMSKLTVFVLLLNCICLGEVVGKDITLVKVNDDNWSQIMEGEWMVEL